MLSRKIKKTYKKLQEIHIGITIGSVIALSTTPRASAGTQ